MKLIRLFNIIFVAILSISIIISIANAADADIEDVAGNSNSGSSTNDISSSTDTISSDATTTGNNQEFEVPELGLTAVGSGSEKPKFNYDDKTSTFTCNDCNIKLLQEGYKEFNGDFSLLRVAFAKNTDGKKPVAEIEGTVSSEAKFSIKEVPFELEKGDKFKWNVDQKTDQKTISVTSETRNDKCFSKIFFSEGTACGSFDMILSKENVPERITLKDENSLYEQGSSIIKGDEGVEIFFNERCQDSNNNCISFISSAFLDKASVYGIVKIESDKLTYSGKTDSQSVIDFKDGNPVKINVLKGDAKIDDVNSDTISGFSMQFKNGKLVTSALPEGLANLPSIEFKWQDEGSKYVLFDEGKVIFGKTEGKENIEYIRIDETGLTAKDAARILIDVEKSETGLRAISFESEIRLSGRTKEEILSDAQWREEEYNLQRKEFGKIVDASEGVLGLFDESYLESQRKKSYDNINKDNGDGIIGYELLVNALAVKNMEREGISKNLVPVEALYMNYEDSGDPNILRNMLNKMDALDREGLNKFNQEEQLYYFDRRNQAINKLASIKVRDISSTRDSLLFMGEGSLIGKSKKFLKLTVLDSYETLNNIRHKIPNDVRLEIPVFEMARNFAAGRPTGLGIDMISREERLHELMEKTALNVNEINGIRSAMNEESWTFEDLRNTEIINDETGKDDSLYKRRQETMKKINDLYLRGIMPEYAELLPDPNSKREQINELVADTVIPGPFDLFAGIGMLKGAGKMGGGTISGAGKIRPGIIREPYLANPLADYPEWDKTGSSIAEKIIDRKMIGLEREGLSDAEDISEEMVEKLRSQIRGEKYYPTKREAVVKMMDEKYSPHESSKLSFNEDVLGMTDEELFMRAKKSLDENELEMLEELYPSKLSKTEGGKIYKILKNKKGDLGEGSEGKVITIPKSVKKDPLIVEKDVIIKIKTSGEKVSFEEQAKLLDELADEGVAPRVYGSDKEYYIADKVDGVKLGSLTIEQKKALGPELKKITDALTKKGILIEDLGGTNIIRKPDGTLKIVDVGNARKRDNRKWLTEYYKLERKQVVTGVYMLY